MEDIKLKKNINLRKVLSTYIFMCLIILGSVKILLDIELSTYDTLVILTFVLNGFVIFLNLMSSSITGYRTKDIMYTYLFVFMFMSPLIQYCENSFPWWDTHLITNTKIIYANILIFLFIIVYEYFYNKPIRRISENKKNRHKIVKIKPVLNFMFLLTLVMGSYIIANIGFNNLFSRAANILNISNSSLYLVVNNSFRSITVMNVALNILYYHKYRSVYRKGNFILSVIIMLLINFPTATARFWMASVYIGLIVICFRRLRNPHLLKMLIIIGLIVIFPLINSFRNSTFGEVIHSEISLPKTTDYFLSGDFDSYSMLVRSIIHVEENGITWGYQLLGNILFFIPRTLWTSKPVGSGLTIATGLGWQFGNVSCPFIGEGFLNFGIVGVILFSIIIAKFTKFIDFKYSNKVLNDDKSFEFIEILFPFSLGFLFFILRGDLLSSLSYYIGFMIPLGILYTLKFFFHRILH